MSTTQAEIVGGQWLVYTSARVATLTYDQHNTATWITLPNQNLWISVPKGVLLHIEDLALYHLPTHTYENELKISPFFQQYSLELDPALEQCIQYEGTQTIHLTLVDTALQPLTWQPLGSAADTALCIATALSYLVNLNFSLILF